MPLLPSPPAVHDGKPHLTLNAALGRLEGVCYKSIVGFAESFAFLAGQETDNLDLLSI